jgi:hypothetical protein
MTTTTKPNTLSAAFEFATSASAYVIDYTDRAGERHGVAFTGSDVFARAKRAIVVLRGRHATRITVTGTWATGEETAELADAE